MGTISLDEYRKLVGGKRRGMNKTEAEYGGYLELLKNAKEIAWYRYEGMTIKLAHDTRYTPDFCVVTKDGNLEFHEVKGFWRDDAKVKIKVAAEMYPFRFFVIKKSKTGWVVEEVVR